MSYRFVRIVFLLPVLAVLASFPAHAAQDSPAVTGVGNAFVPPPPTPDSPQDRDDRYIFKATRALKDTERWMLAAHDSDLETPVLLDDFSCAAGFRLDAARAPNLAALLDRMKAALKSTVSAEKKYWHRPRPFVEDPDAPLCVARPVGEKPSFAYPSGHTTEGWATALLLAHLMPGHVSGIMERGRVFGESRVVCGVHWASDVWAGYMNGSVLFNAFLSEPGVAPLVVAAQADIAGLEKQPVAPVPAMCAAEHNAAAFSPLTQIR
ncbi:hypothetical protein B0W47_07025 [Komagataeibacter nataicola]|uniref:Acid phosphatase n=1 Tax=Komagataeibacter nataicola TaxID=265960 RepID=A0A9N7H2N3_9PROT|nr:hypothetical protein B0W47_07025 [Komagataeibacter nataicola]